MVNLTGLAGLQAGVGLVVRPKRGRAVLMDQDVLHRVSAPSAAAGGRPRYSLVWKLVLPPSKSAIACFLSVHAREVPVTSFRHMWVLIIRASGQYRQQVQTQGGRKVAPSGEKRCSERFEMVLLILSFLCTAGVPAQESDAALLPGAARVGRADQHRLGCACGTSQAEPQQKACQAGREE